MDQKAQQTIQGDVLVQCLLSTKPIWIPTWLLPFVEQQLALRPTPIHYDALS